nr:GUN4 domain-containing protein [Cylindrospermopsis raciborskii]
MGIHGQTYSQSLGDGRGTPEEYGIPIKTYQTWASQLSTPSVVNTRYKRLESLLRTQNFREADEETNKVILKVARRERQGWLRKEDEENFPCKELRTIDQLWLKHSKGKFGISVQQEIYESLDKDPSLFGDRVGWRRTGRWLSYKNINFSQTAPSGHLPFVLPFLFREGGGWLERFGRWVTFPSVQTCRV